jgi:RES domain-containing protein
MEFFPEIKALFHRIVQAEWSASALDGEGGCRYGGRWNLPGVVGVYVVESRALAALEILLHAPREAQWLDWMVIELDIPDSQIVRVLPVVLPENWRAQPSSREAQAFGTNWLRSNGNPALRLPSVVIPEESSFLLNPFHPLIKELSLRMPRPFRFDSRLTG